MSKKSKKKKKKQVKKYNFKDKVNHPSHYNRGKIEVIEFINDQDLKFNLGNSVKYICRADYKGKKEEDLRKAIFYINYEIELLKTNPRKPNEMAKAGPT